MVFEHVKDAPRAWAQRRLVAGAGRRRARLSPDALLAAVHRQLVDAGGVHARGCSSCSSPGAMTATIRNFRRATRCASPSPAPSRRSCAHCGFSETLIAPFFGHGYLRVDSGGARGRRRAACLGGAARLCAGSPLTPSRWCASSRAARSADENLRSSGPRAAAPSDRAATAADAALAPQVVIFGSAKPVTCAVLDYARAARRSRQRAASRLRRASRPSKPERPFAFVGAIARALDAGAVVHLQLPIEGWGNSVVPGSALFAARALTRQAAAS